MDDNEVIAEFLQCKYLNIKLKEMMENLMDWSLRWEGVFQGKIWKEVGNEKKLKVCYVKKNYSSEDFFKIMKLFQKLKKLS